MTEIEKKARALKFGESVFNEHTGAVIERTFGGYVYYMGNAVCFVPEDKADVVQREEKKDTKKTVTK